VLDKPTSALDSRHEQLIRETFGTIKGERTVVLVSHRISAVMGCDRIYVLDKGGIAEQGNHGELIRLGAIYAAMSKQQQLQPDTSMLTAAA
jgi:ABC-type multidrug transport system fused ATPase/permease subunit